MTVTPDHKITLEPVENMTCFFVVIAPYAWVHSFEHCNFIVLALWMWMRKLS